MKTICFIILFFCIAMGSYAQPSIVLTKQKRNGKEKTRKIGLNNKVKVYYLSEERLSFSDRPPLVLHKRKTGDKYIGLADGKLLEINQDHLLIRRLISKDLIKVPVGSLIAIGKYNSFERFGTLILASFGTLVATDIFWEQQLGSGYDEFILMGTFLVVGPVVLQAIDKGLFPAHKIREGNKGYRMEIR